MKRAQIFNRPEIPEGKVGVIPNFRNHPGPTFAFVAPGDKGSGGPYRWV